MKPKVFVVDGHTIPTDYGQIIPYSKYRNLYNEALLIRATSNRLRELLNNINYLDTFFFNVDNKNLNHPLSRKVDVINYSYSDRKKDLAIELHFDYVSNQSVNGRSIIIGTNDKLGLHFKNAFDIKEIKNRDTMTTAKYWFKERKEKCSPPYLIKGLPDH